MTCSPQQSREIGRSLLAHTPYQRTDSTAAIAICSIGLEQASAPVVIETFPLNQPNSSVLGGRGSRAPSGSDPLPLGLSRHGQCELRSAEFYLVRSTESVAQLAIGPGRRVTRCRIIAFASNVGTSLNSVVVQNASSRSSPSRPVRCHQGLLRRCARSSARSSLLSGGSPAQPPGCILNRQRPRPWRTPRPGPAVGQKE